MVVMMIKEGVTMRFLTQFILVVSLSLFVAAGVNAADEQISKKDPYALIEQVSEKTFERFRQDRPLIEQDINHLKVIVEQELMPYIHHRYSAAKVLGKNYKKLSKEKFKDFSKVFRDYLIYTYANVFTLYDHQKVVYSNPKKSGKSRIASVRVSIIDDNRPPIKIDFKLIKSKKTGDWNAFDMSAEGISMVDSKHKEFNAVIRKHGVDYLMEKLASKAAQSVEKKVVK